MFSTDEWRVSATVAGFGSRLGTVGAEAFRGRVLATAKERPVSMIYRGVANDLLQYGFGDISQVHISDIGAEFVGIHGSSLRIGWKLDVRSKGPHIVKGGVEVTSKCST